MDATLAEVPLSPTESVTSVNVPFPLLRHMMFAPTGWRDGTPALDAVARNVQVDVTVMVIVDEGHTDVISPALDSGRSVTSLKVPFFSLWNSNTSAHG